jgi:Flp pilus assembly protein TadD
MTSGKLYLKQNEVDKAIHWFQEAIKLKPQNPEAHFLLGKAQAQKGLLMDMARSFETSLSLSDKYAKDINEMRRYYYAESFNNGVKYAQAEDWQKAAESFTISRTIQPDEIDAHKNLAFVYMRAQNDSMGIVVYNEILKIKPDDVDALSMLGDVRAAKKDYAGAVEYYKKVLAADSTNGRATHGLALCYDYLGQRDNAMAAYESALRARPEDKDLRFNYGRLYYLREEYEKAIEQFTLVLAQDPNDVDANMNAGIAYLKIGEKHDKPIQDIEGKGMNMTKAQTKELEALKAQQKEIFSKAVPYLQRATEVASTNASAWYNLGVAYIRMGDTVKGQEAVKKGEELGK